MGVDAEVLRQWSQLHDGYDVDRSRLVLAWLRAVHVLAAPLVRLRIPATVVTVAGVLAAAGAALVGGPAAAPLVVLTAVCDGVDGAVALLAGRVSRRGAVVDHTADRVTDVLFALALWRAGAPLWLAVTAATATIGYELSRSAARLAGRTVDVVTVGERPIRVCVVALGLVVAPTVGATTVVVVAVVSCAQLVFALCFTPRSG